MSMLVDSCIAPFTIKELRALADDPKIKDSIQIPSPLDEENPVSYGTIRGSQRLRSLISNLFAPSPVTAEDVVVTSGAISANFLILDTLCGPGDHIICTYPTYGQLYELPRRSGADVSLWREKEDGKGGWTFDVDDLRSLVKDNTKMIIVNNPTNPTGNVIPRETLEAIVSIAAKRNIIVFADEVFRPLFHDKNTAIPPSLMELEYPNSIVTGSELTSTGILDRVRRG